MIEIKFYEESSGNKLIVGDLRFDYSESLTHLLLSFPQFRAHETEGAGIWDITY